MNAHLLDAREVLGRGRRIVEVRQLEGHKDIVWAVAFSPDGKRAVSAGGFQPGPSGRGFVPGNKDFAVRLWDVVAGRELRRLEGHADAVACLAFSPDGRRVLSAGAETLKLRDDATTARVSLAMGEALSEKGDHGAAVKRYFAAYGRDHGLAPAVAEKLRRMIEAEGSLPLASLALGKILASEGRSTEAVEALRAARTADPKLSDTVLGELQRLRDAAPADPQPGLLMLAILAESGDHKRAVQVISALLDARSDLASVLAGHLDRILKADPQQAFATFELGRALQQLGLHPRSAASYLAAFRLDATLAPMILRRLQEAIEPTASHRSASALAYVTEPIK